MDSGKCATYNFSHGVGEGRLGNFFFVNTVSVSSLHIVECSINFGSTQMKLQLQPRLNDDNAHRTL